MKAAHNYSAKPQNHAPWLTFGLKQNWQMLVFYAVLLFLPCIMITVTGISNALELLQGDFYGISYGGVWRSPAELGDEQFMILATAFAILSCFVGVFAGMSANGYVNSRRAIHCYHSLPLTRDALYLENSAIHTIYYLAAGLLTLVISTAAILIRLGMTLAGLGAGLWLMLVGLAGYAVVFGLFQLAGSLTGTAVFRFCMAGILAFLPVVLYLLLWVGVDEGMQHIQTDHYLNDGRTARLLCPAVNLYCTMSEMIESKSFHSREPLVFWQKLLALLGLVATAAVYYLAGLWCSRKRPSERAENALVWKRLGVFVKYPVVFVCAGFGGLLFREIFGSGDTWMVFGGIMGLVLSFFLMNVLLERNTKSMFRGLRGLGITALCTALFFAVIPFDLFHLDRFMYDAENVKYIHLRFNDDVDVTDPGQIEVVMNAIQQEISYETADAPQDDRRNMPTYYIDSSQVIGQKQSVAEALLLRYCPDRYMPDAGEDPMQFYWVGGDVWQKLASGEPYVVRESAYGEVTVESKAYMDGSYGGDLNMGYDYLYFSVYPKFGMPIHRYIRVPALSESQEIYEIAEEILLEPERYDILQTVDPREVGVFVSVFGEGHTLQELYILPEKAETSATSAALEQEYYNAVAQLLQSVTADPTMAGTLPLGSLQISNHDDIQEVYTLYAGMTEFWQAWADFCAWLPDFQDRASGILELPRSLENLADDLTYTRYQLYDDPTAVTEWLTETIAHAWVIEADTGRSLYVDRSDLSAMLSATVNRDYESNHGTRARQYLVVTLKYSTDAIRKGTNHTTPDTADIYYTHTWFREGCVPDFVTEAFQ